MYQLAFEDPSFSPPCPSYEFPELPLRDYQIRANDNVFEDYINGIMQLLVSLPTGAGKTWTVFATMFRFLPPGARAILCMPRIDLVNKTYRDLIQFIPESEVGIVQGTTNQVGRRFIIASTQTLQNKERREQLLAAQNYEKFLFFHIDEAHLLTASFKDILKDLEHPQAMRVIGTATPFRRDEISLKILAKKVSAYEDMLDLILQGYLMGPTCYKRRVDLDLKDTELRGLYSSFDKVPQSVLKKVKQQNKYAIAYDSWVNLIKKQRTIIFANDAHKDVWGYKDYFTKKGVRCEVITGSTDTKLRDKWLEEFKAGELLVLINYDVLATGIDVPETVGIIIGRNNLMGDDPHKGKHTQIIGRGTRLAEGKTEFIVVYLTSERYQTPPLIGSNYDDLPGDLIEGITYKKVLMKELKEKEEEREETNEEGIERKPLDIEVIIKKRKAEVFSVFHGDGWLDHINGDYTKETPFGTLVAERESFANYSIFLEKEEKIKDQEEPKITRHKITKEPCSADIARARGMQYIDDLKRNKERNVSTKPLTRDQINYLYKRRKVLRLPDRYYDFMQQKDYYLLEKELKKRDREQKQGKPFRIITWKPQEGISSFTPEKKIV